MPLLRVAWRFPSFVCTLPSPGRLAEGGWTRLEGHRGPCTPRWALPPARSPVLFMHQTLGEQDFFEEREMSLP